MQQFFRQRLVQNSIHNSEMMDISRTSAELGFMRFCGTIIAFYVILGLSAGCSNRPDPGAAFEIPKDLPPPAAAPKPKEAVLDPPDHSLTVENYAEAGMPPLDRPWSGKDMTDAVRVCMSIAETSSNRLPRCGSTRSNAVFERMTSVDNLAYFRDQSIPIEKRLGDFLTYMYSSNRITQIYLAAFSKNAIGGTDVVDLYGNLIRSWATIRSILDEIVPTIDKKDPNYAPRIAHLEDIRKELGTVALGSLKMFADNRYLNTAQQKRYIGYLQTSLPEIVPVLLPEKKDEVLAQLKEYDANPKMEKLKPELTELVKKVNDAALTNSGL